MHELPTAALMAADEDFEIILLDADDRPLDAGLNEGPRPYAVMNPAEEGRWRDADFFCGFSECECHAPYAVLVLVL